MRKVRILASGGVGDLMLAFQCGFYIKDSELEIVIRGRDEVFLPIKALFSDKYNIIQDSPEITENDTINNPEIWNRLAIANENYFIVPDLLFRNKQAFDYQKYNVSLETIKTTRLLTDKYRPGKKIYVGLSMFIKERRYKHIKKLLELLGKEFPDYLVIFPFVQNWNGQPMNLGEFDGLPDNIVIDSKSSLSESIVNDLFTSSYGIFSDNGPSNIAFLCGLPRLLLDDKLGNPLWLSRWRYGGTDSIDSNTAPEDVARVVKTNLNIPQTMLLSREMVLFNPTAGWSSALNFKY